MRPRAIPEITRVVNVGMQSMSHGRANPPVTGRANPVTALAASAVSRLSRAVTARPPPIRDNECMTNPDFLADQNRLAQLVAIGTRPAVDAFLGELHTKYHDRPGEHVRVHLAWMRVYAGRGSYLRALGHAFAGIVVAGPASLVQRYTGLVVPAFDAERRS